MKKSTKRSTSSPPKRLVLRRDVVGLLAGVSGSRQGGGDNTACTANETGCAGSSLCPSGDCPVM
jgi:hypothetical protein